MTMFRKLNLYLSRILPRRMEYRRRVLDDTATTDFSSLTHNWSQTIRLFDELKKKCHPDKFSDDLSTEATRIFQNVMQNKYNFTKLQQIKEEAIRVLGISVDM